MARMPIILSPYSLGRFDLVKAMYVGDESAIIMLFVNPKLPGRPMIRMYVTPGNCKSMIINNNPQYKYTIAHWAREQFEIVTSRAAAQIYLNLGRAEMIS